MQLLVISSVILGKILKFHLDQGVYKKQGYNLVFFIMAVSAKQLLVQKLLRTIKEYFDHQVLVLFGG